MYDSLHTDSWFLSMFSYFPFNLRDGRLSYLIDYLFVSDLYSFVKVRMMVDLLQKGMP